MVVSIGPFKRPVDVYFPGDEGSGAAEILGVRFDYYFNNNWDIGGVNHMIIAARIVETPAGVEVSDFRGSNMDNLYYFAPHDYCDATGGNDSDGMAFIVDLGVSDENPWLITQNPDSSLNEFIYDGTTLQVHVWGQYPDRTYLDLGVKSIDLSGLVLTSRLTGGETYSPVGFFETRDMGYRMQVVSI